MYFNKNRTCRDHLKEAQSLSNQSVAFLLCDGYVIYLWQRHFILSIFCTTFADNNSKRKADDETFSILAGGFGAVHAAKRGVYEYSCRQEGECGRVGDVYLQYRLVGRMSQDVPLRSGHASCGHDAQDI